MLCLSSNGFIWISLVALVIATDYSDAYSAAGLDPEDKVYRLRRQKQKSPPVNPVQEVKETAGADLELPAETKNISLEEKGRRLIEAAKIGAVKELQSLLAAGADMGSRDNTNWTALHWAARYGHAEAVKILVAAGADVEPREKLQMTPLHWAAYWDQPAVVRLLVASSADPNARNAWQWTPLHFAAYDGHTEAGRALLEVGADMEAKNSYGQTPLDIARQRNKQQFIDLLTLS